MCEDVVLCLTWIFGFFFGFISDSLLWDIGCPVILERAFPQLRSTRSKPSQKFVTINQPKQNSKVFLMFLVGSYWSKVFQSISFLCFEKVNLSPISLISLQGLSSFARETQSCFHRRLKNIIPHNFNQIIVEADGIFQSSCQGDQPQTLNFGPGPLQRSRMRRSRRGLSSTIFWSKKN